MVGNHGAFEASGRINARAKCEAEAHMLTYARAGGTVVMLRPGCVWGPGSDLWVGRIGRLLRSRRLGDLGAAGDGWTNLVHVDDVCKAAVAALGLVQPRGEIRTYNLAAPDSPRSSATANMPGNSTLGWPPLREL